MMKTIAVILAGGTGSRCGLDKPKQFFEYKGRTVLEYSVDAFHRHACVDEIIVVSNPDFLDETEKIVKRNAWPKVKSVVAGGKERYDSTLNALKAVKKSDGTADFCNILFHDAVRPFVSQRIIGDVCAALENHRAVNVTVPVTDTIVECDGDTMTAVPERSKLQRVQTPQGFRFDVIDEAYRRALRDENFKATDDCGVVFKYCPEVPIFLVRGEETNMKITYKEDLDARNFGQLTEKS